MSLQTALHETPFQIINIYSIRVKTGLQSYCGSSYSRSGVNQMWILNFKDLFEYIQSRINSSYNSIKQLTYVPSTQLFPPKAKRISPTVFLKTMANVDAIHYLRKGQILFCKTNYSDSSKKSSETYIIQMFDFLIDDKRKENISNFPL